MSAQETTPGQAASRASLIASISSKPRRVGSFGGLSFSGVGLNGSGPGGQKHHSPNHHQRNEINQVWLYSLYTLQIGFLPCQYLDETVVEEHADHGSAIAGVLEDGLLHDALDDGLRLGHLS
ncbi:hypothetical protein ZWY2020_037015 [Hordeum vulgare]|nr:hypothetical protein ZWY2020_037015 [Hordeum vulgare]